MKFKTNSVLAGAGAAAVLLLLNWRTYFVEMKSYTHSVLATTVARAVAAVTSEPLQ